MALHDTIDVPKNEWRPITSGSINTLVRIQNVGGNTVMIQGTAVNTAPSGADAAKGAVHIPPGGGERVSHTIDFAGVTSAAYLWAFCDMRESKVSVSHG